MLGWCTVDISSHRPLRIMLGWCTVDIILLSIEDNAWMVHSGYHPLKHRPLRIMLGWCTVDIILLSLDRPLDIIL